MKTLLFAFLLGCSVAGLQAGPDADALKNAIAWQAKNDAAISKPAVDPVVAELRKQTELQAEQIRLMKLQNAKLNQIDANTYGK